MIERCKGDWLLGRKLTRGVAGRQGGCRPAGRAGAAVGTAVGLEMIAISLSATSLTQLREQRLPIKRFDGTKSAMQKAKIGSQAGHAEAIAGAAFRHFEKYLLTYFFSDFSHL